MSSGIDHLVVAGGHLEALISWFEESAGVRPTPGGPHPGAGTRNALVSLGPSTYLELIGPDPDQPKPSGLRPFGIDGLEPGEIKFATFAVAVDDVESSVARLAATEAIPGEVQSMARTRPDGVELSWKLAVPNDERQQGIVPFLIEWGNGTPHPASDSVEGCHLAALSLQHPDPDFINAALAELDLNEESLGLIEVGAGHPAVVSATLETPNGALQL